MSYLDGVVGCHWKIFARLSLSYLRRSNVSLRHLLPKREWFIRTHVLQLQLLAMRALCQTLIDQTATTQWHHGVGRRHSTSEYSRTPPEQLI